jgi:3-oxoacyl-[acyl-carrier protein] reductase
MSVQKTVLIGGASAGIGFACAKLFAEQGMRVIGYARGLAKLKQAFAQLPGNGHAVFAIDSGSASDIASLIEQVRSLCAPQIMINNSGGPAPGPIRTAQPEQFQVALQQHVLAAHALAQAFLGDMQAHGFGRIVNIISTSVKEPLKDLGVSNTIRAAMGAWAKTLASEVASFGITVNNVLPGFTETDRLETIVQNKMQKSGKLRADVQAELFHEVPAGRFASAAETAAAVAFLCSESAGYITGINLPVDGGRTRSL